MPRLRNKQTGVIVDVDEETAALLSVSHESADGVKAPARRPRKRAETDTEE